MTIPGCRRRGFSPLPSAGLNGIEPAGWSMAVVICPEEVCQSRTKGFSMKMLSERKKANVTSETMITHGKNS